MHKILDYSNSKWADLVKLYNLDIYFTPQYCKIWEDYADGKAQAFLYESSLGKILYPYLVRKIGYIKSNINYFDISTPYGYGGPVLLEYKENEIPLLVKKFRAEFNTYAHKKGIISEFIRFHPVYKNYIYFLDSDIKCKYVRNTIEMNLTLAKEEILKNMNASARNQVRQAIRNGLNVVFKNNPALEDIKLFYKIYSENMNKLGASDYYKFSLIFFLNTFSLLKENSEIAFVYKDNNLISSGIFLFGNDVTHYHFSGSLRQYSYLRPTNIMLYEAALKYKSMGKKCFHLGGGYSGNDSLYSFKKGFNKNSVLDFYVGNKINNKYIYDKLVKEWKIKNRIEESFESDFFPLYRL